MNDCFVGCYPSLMAKLPSQFSQCEWTPHDPLQPLFQLGPCFVDFFNIGLSQRVPLSCHSCCLNGGLLESCAVCVWDLGCRGFLLTWLPRHLQWTVWGIFGGWEWEEGWRVQRGNERGGGRKREHELENSRIIAFRSIWTWLIYNS